MKNQFVNEEQAKALKLLGFDDLFFGVYVDGKFYRDYDTFQWNDFGNVIKAPLKQQVMKWMLEKHSVYGWVEHYWYPLGYRWKACVKNLDGGKAQIAGELKSHEEAMNKCIDMLIEYVKD